MYKICVVYCMEELCSHSLVLSIFYAGCHNNNTVIPRTLTLSIAIV